MKWLITFALLIGRQLDWAPETIVRLPNVLAGALSILIVAQLGKRLFGETAGIIAAAITAFSPTWIGYQRAAKEDTLLALFLMLLLWCASEAKAAADSGRPKDQRRWEWFGAASLGGMFASKYFFFLAPIPVVVYLWLRLGTNTTWRMSFKRWMQLGLAALACRARQLDAVFARRAGTTGSVTWRRSRRSTDRSSSWGELFHNLRAGVSRGLRRGSTWCLRR